MQGSVEESFGLSINNDLQKEFDEICIKVKGCDLNEKRSENVGEEDDSERVTNYSGSNFVSKNINSQCYIVQLHLTKYLEYSEVTKKLLDRNLLSPMSSLENCNDPEYYNDTVFSNFTFRNLFDVALELNFKKKNPCVAIALVDKMLIVAYNSNILPNHKGDIQEVLKKYEIDTQNLVCIENKERAHAEMKILEYLEKYVFKNRCYIATSMETCPLCYISLKYFKNVERYCIMYRKSHNNLSIGDKWPVLDFMKKHDTLFDHFNYYLEVYVFPRIVSKNNEEKYEVDKEKVTRHVFERNDDVIKDLEDIINKNMLPRSLYLPLDDGELSTRVSKRNLADYVVLNPRQVNIYVLQTP